MTDASVVGLGLMGSSLATRLLDSGLSVSVWNRTPERIVALTRRGAEGTEGLVAAVEASPITLICVDTYQSVEALIEGLTHRGIRAGCAVVNLTTGNADEAEAMENSVSAMGIGYLDGHIGVTPNLIGDERTSLLFAGATAVWERCERLLLTLGPASVYLGEDVRAIGSLCAGVSVFFNSALTGYLEGLSYARSVGVSLEVFRQTAENRLITLQEFLRVCSRQAANGEYEPELSNVQAHLDALTSHLRTLEKAGASRAMGEAAAGHMQGAVDAGSAGKEITVLVDLLASGSRSAAPSGRRPN